ncbi:acyltransferase [Emticicia sp. 21SJ11W-3]|uniref:acyltransferase family protein n=1 Tax=Emticicia sp. 21SJ11W-3 TaxID=2916755 RepID=UPI0020A22ED9|nr:acyltransferase [Emticicia sp. 21SJ11W-3]UTA66796.1 acyltransferase [Emticicia sp. 21SJ11W-3]
MSAKNTSYLKQLDGIRFIAVSLVLIDHWSDDRLKIPFGFLGVCIFFVLSGFLITRILLNAKDKDEALGRSHGFSLKQFYIRRTIRIFPVYYLSILVLYVLNVPPVREKIIWCLTYSTNIYIAIHQSWLGVIDHLWSLAVEEQFYLFFPFVVFFIPSRYLVRVLYGFIILSVALRFVLFLNNVAWMASYVLMPTCLDAFGMGGLLAYFFYHKNEKVKAFITNKLWLVLSIVVYAGVVGISKMISEEQNIITIVFLRLFESLLALFLVGNAAYNFGGIARFVLENKVAVYLGRISYGIYIYHNFIYNYYHSGPLHPTVRVLDKLPFIAHHLPLKFIFLYAVTVAAATVSWFLIEKPINQWKDKFGY